MATTLAPPGGIAGFSQMTAASRMALQAGMRGAMRTATRRRRRKAKSGAKRAKSGSRKLKFGSPAWRAKYMKGRKRRRK